MFDSVYITLRAHDVNIIRRSAIAKPHTIIVLQQCSYVMFCMWFIKRLLRFDISKDIPKQVRRLFGISFTPILPIYHSKSETGFVSHDPFQIASHQFSFYLSRRTYSRSDQAI
jgi:hypothetical protein